MAGRRTDWLKHLSGLLAVAIALLGIEIGGRLLAAVRRTDLCATVIGPQIGADGLRPGVTTRSVEACVEHPSAAQAWLHAAAEVPTYVVLLVVTVLLLRIVNDARRRDPFSTGTVGRLRVLALVGLVGGLAADFTNLVVTDPLADSLAAGTIADGPETPWFWLYGSFAVAAVAEVLRRGVAMRDELDAVI